MITLTKKMVDGMRTDGGSYTTATIKALGFEWKDLKGGWPSKIVGMRFTEEQYAAAVAGRSVFVASSNTVLRSRKEEVRDRAVKFMAAHGFNASSVTTVAIANTVNAMVFGVLGAKISKTKCIEFLEGCINAGFLDRKWNSKTPHECWEQAEAAQAPVPSAAPKAQSPTPPRPSTDPAYSRNKYLAMLDSQAWRKLRIAVLLHYGRKCCLCGDSDEVIQVDHIVPASVDWSRRMDFDNLQVLCKPCNLGKGNRYTDDWRR